jgi:hypothetical protein
VGNATHDGIDVDALTIAAQPLSAPQTFSPAGMELAERMCFRRALQVAMKAWVVGSSDPGKVPSAGGLPAH